MNGQFLVTMYINKWTTGPLFDYNIIGFHWKIYLHAIKFDKPKTKTKTKIK